jgi:hypothetical protein
MKMDVHDANYNERIRKSELFPAFLRRSVTWLHSKERSYSVKFGIVPDSKDGA